VTPAIAAKASTDRSPCASFGELLDRVQQAFVDSVESTRPELRGGLPDSVFLSAAVEALGLERARPLLEGLAGGPRGAAAEAYLARVRAEGFTPRAAHFAARRYRRWLAVNPGATVEARGAILAELWGTYRLAHLEATWPDVRVRFFRQTVFAGARQELGAALDRLMEAARGPPGSALNLEEQIAPIREALRPTAEEDYFLARLAYRYLRPTDEASLISLPSGEHVVAEVVVALTDEEGERFKVRAPASPREVARLLQLFLDANLLVTFTAEHEFLLALDEDDALLGGLFYRRVGRDRAHMEKIVIARPHQGKGVSGGLMRELVRRLRARGVRALETGYFRPDWFEKYGFRTDPTSGGLVLEIGDEPATRL
jgi:GNAT superfamily N-acetyltransferase